MPATACMIFLFMLCISGDAHIYARVTSFYIHTLLYRNNAGFFQKTQKSGWHRSNAPRRGLHTEGIKNYGSGFRNDFNHSCGIWWKSLRCRWQTSLWIKYCFRKAERIRLSPPNNDSNAYERQYKNKEGCIVKCDNSIYSNCIKNKLKGYDGLKGYDVLKKQSYRP